MPLNLSSGGDGEFTPYIKFNAKAGRWYTKNETGEEYEVREVTALFDLKNIRTGWIEFSDGAAPDMHFDINGHVGVRPGPRHRRGFVVNVFSPANFGGLKEWSSCSSAAITPLMDVYAKWEASAEAGAGKLPIVACKGVIPKKAAKGTNYQPILEIVGWSDRPKEVPDAPARNNNPAPSAPTAQTGAPPPPPAQAAMHMPPPPPAQQPQSSVGQPAF